MAIHTIHAILIPLYLFISPYPLYSINILYINMKKKAEKEKDGEAAAKVKIEILRPLANRLIQRKRVGDSYSDVIESLLDDVEKREK